MYPSTRLLKPTAQQRKLELDRPGESTSNRWIREKTLIRTTYLYRITYSERTICTGNFKANAYNSPIWRNWPKRKRGKRGPGRISRIRPDRRLRPKRAYTNCRSRHRTTSLSFTKARPSACPVRTIRNSSPLFQLKKNINKKIQSGEHEVCAVTPGNV